MTTLVYSQHRPPVGLGQFAFRNPRFFNGVDPKARAVYVLGDSLQDQVVRAAYTKAGVPVLAAGDALAEQPAPGAVTIPDDWQTLPWTQQGDLEGLTLRGLASDLSGEPIKNKTQAIEAIQTELARRAADHHQV